MVRIVAETSMRGQTSTAVVVADGGVLKQLGQVDGDITVEVGGHLEHHGHVNGDIHGYGSVVVAGHVNGELHAYEGSRFIVLEGVQFGEPRRFVTPQGQIAPVPTSGTFTTRTGPSRWQLQPDGTLTEA
jgi:hypothetical protein